MRPYNSFGENQIKHLEMIQAALIRHETGSVRTKRWSFVLTAGLLALAVQQQECLLGAASVAITIGMWILDHDFLRSQRLFGKLYEQVRTGDKREPFFIDATGEEFVAHLEKANLHHDALRWTVFKSRSLWMVYSMQILAGAVVWLVLRITVG